MPTADVNIRCRAGYTALHVCVERGYADGVRLILPKVVDIDECTSAGFDPGTGRPVQGSHGQTALHIAAHRGQHHFAKALLKPRASRMARNSQQHTPLHLAALAGQLSSVILLLGQPGRYKMRPSEVDAADFMGGTALHTAAGGGHTQICAALLAAGARKDAKMHTHNTPLEFAIALHSSNAALIALLSESASPDEEAPVVGASCEQCGATAGLKACGGCAAAVYCGPACSAAAWPAHKAECKRRSALRVPPAVRTITFASDLPPASRPPQASSDATTA